MAFQPARNLLDQIYMQGTRCNADATPKVYRSARQNSRPAARTNQRRSQHDCRPAMPPPQSEAGIGYNFFPVVISPVSFPRSGVPKPPHASLLLPPPHPPSILNRSVALSPRQPRLLPDSPRQHEAPSYGRHLDRAGSDLHRRVRR